MQKKVLNNFKITLLEVDEENVRIIKCEQGIKIFIEKCCKLDMS